MTAAIPSVRFTFLLVLVVATAAGQNIAPSQESPVDGLVSRILRLIDQRDSGAAEDLVREYWRLLDQKLDGVLADIDRDFDELGRQKARSDMLEKKFDQLNADLSRYDELFQIHSKVTGKLRLRTRLRAKRLRIEGAEHTTRADLLWDNLDYDGALREYANAVKSLQSAIPLARSVDDQKLVASCLNNIGYAEIYSGEPERGIGRYFNSLRIADQRRDDVYRGLYLLNLGTAFLYTGKPQDSLQYSVQAVEMTQKTGRKTWEANAFLNLGSAYLSLGRLEEAKGYLEKAWEKSEEANDRRSRGRVLYNQALLAASLGQHGKSAHLMEEALGWYVENEEIYSKAEQTVIQYHALNFLRSAYQRLGDEEKAKHYAAKAKDFVNRDPKKVTAYLSDPHLNAHKSRTQDRTRVQKKPL